MRFSFTENAHLLVTHAPTRSRLHWRTGAAIRLYGAAPTGHAVVQATCQVAVLQGGKQIKCERHSADATRINPLLCYRTIQTPPLFSAHEAGSSAIVVLVPHSVSCTLRRRIWLEMSLHPGR